MHYLVNEAKFFPIVIFLFALFVCRVHGFNVLRSNDQDLLKGIQQDVDGDNNLYNYGVYEETDDGTTSTIINNATICAVNDEYKPVDVDISRKFPGFNFNATWISRKYFWLSDDFSFESRYRYNYELVLRTQKLVKVFILPHSHNDPGWLNTYEQYYYRQTKHILDNAVRQLSVLPQMTFVWSEITYLAKWWKEASPLNRERFHKLVVDEGRLEIATAGWVVPDEATPSLYTLLAELTEGQQWVKNHLNTTAKYSWAIDPFGHSSTHAHLLKQAGMKGMVIQRLHYAWKHWLAEHKKGEFRWRPRWSTDDGKQDIPCLSLPFDLYSIKHACGPDPQVCLKFDFRDVLFEYGENYGLMTPITKVNVKQLAEEIVAQYHKTASLTNHNVILVPLGDDFRYDRTLEWEQQYGNYMQLFSYINNNTDKFRMEIQFGTLRDYFETVEEIEKKRIEKEEPSSRPSLSGDFFPYSDVYVSGRPAYWTGFYGTRPYWKKFHRELENELRSAEILFTFANVLARKLNSVMEMKTLSYKYQDLIAARQEFSVFAHHDGITGTSRSWTMDDYGDRLHSAYLKCISVQQQSLKIIYQKSPVGKSMLASSLAKDFLRERFERLPSKVPLELFMEEDDYATKLMLFNNLGWNRTELVKVFVKKEVVVKVTDSKGNAVPSQINPVFSHDEKNNSIHLSERMYELVFLATLEPLSTAVFKITKVAVDQEEDADDYREMAGFSRMAVVSCDNCVKNPENNGSHFTLEKFKQEDLVMENSENVLTFQNNGLLENIYLKTEKRALPVQLSFGMYRPANMQSGAYLLKPVMSPEWKFFNSSQVHLIRISGPVMSQLISIHHDRYETIKVNTTLIKIPTSALPKSSKDPQGILLETYVDFTRDYSHRAEVYMRLDTGINSTSENVVEQKSVVKTNLTENKNLAMYTDQNGLVCEKRMTIPSLQYEGNTYPVTTMAFLQDERKKMRFSVLVDRTHGFCSMENGRLESLIERKSLYDDGRGMSEGVTDGRPTVSTYVLLVENLEESKLASSAEAFADWQPTLAAYKTSFRQNYPANLFVFNEPRGAMGGDDGNEKFEEPTISLISSPLPDNVHLLNLRSLSAKDNETDVASATALVNFQYLLDFESGNKRQCSKTKSDSDNGSSEDDRVNLMSGEELRGNGAISAFKINYLNASRFVRTSLTGVEDEVATVSEKTVDLEGNETQQLKQSSSSLLINFKLFFE